MSVRELMELAREHGVKVRAHPTNPDLIFLVCEKCGYGTAPELAVRSKQFMREPFGCTVCAVGGKGMGNHGRI